MDHFTSLNLCLPQLAMTEACGRSIRLYHGTTMNSLDELHIDSAPSEAVVSVVLYKPFLDSFPIMH